MYASVATSWKFENGSMCIFNSRFMVCLEAAVFICMHVFVIVLYTSACCPLLSKRLIIKFC